MINSQPNINSSPYKNQYLLYYQIMEEIQTNEFWNNGFIHFHNFFTDEEVTIIQAEAKRLYELPETPFKWMKYYESNNPDQLSRVEYFYKYVNNDFKNLIETKVKPVLERIYGTKLNLFKDKLNWKFSGGGAFAPHQDHPAWKDFEPDRYINTMLYIDDMTPENGCLEVAPNSSRDNIYNLDQSGNISNSLIEQTNWFPLKGTRRDLLLFDSYVLHRSGPNHSDKSRRAMFLTYNSTEYGNLYEAYFAKKREEFPPPIEREEGREYNSVTYNLGNPIK